jgi:hypothetical protein
MLKEYAKLNQACVQSFEKLRDKETCFDWEKSLLKIVDKSL